MNPPLAVVVAGAAGRMGSLVCSAIQSAADMALVGSLVRGDDPDRVFGGSAANVLVDFSLAEASMALASRAVECGLSPVIGTSGWSAGAVQSLAGACRQWGLGGLLVPNFSLGAVLQMLAAEQAARQLCCTGIDEAHHPAKRDSPSGTARTTAERVQQAAGSPSPPPIRSTRREGVLARQRVSFEGLGERLTLEHEVTDRRAYLPGVLLAIRRVRALVGLHVGLEHVLGGPVPDAPAAPAPSLAPDCYHPARDDVDTTSPEWRNR